MVEAARRNADTAANGRREKRGIFISGASTGKHTTGCLDGNECGALSRKTCAASGERGDKARNSRTIPKNEGQFIHAKWLTPFPGRRGIPSGLRWWIWDGFVVSS